MIHTLSAQDQTMGLFLKSQFDCQELHPKSFYVSRTIVYVDGLLAVNNDGLHDSDARICALLQLTMGWHSVYIVGFEAFRNSELEITYSGPDTSDIRTVIGGKPFFYACDPKNPLYNVDSFTICTFKSDPTTSFNGDCTPTVGIQHPRYPGPCSQAIGTSSMYFNKYAGGFYIPVLGSANEAWVSTFKCKINLINLSNKAFS